MFEAYEFSNQGFTVFLATELMKGKSSPQISENGMACRCSELDEVGDFVRCGKVKGAPSIAALALVSRHLNMA